MTPVISPTSPTSLLYLLCREEPAILAGKTDCLAARVVYVLDDLLVDEAGEHHLHYFKGLFVRYTQPVHKLCRNLQILKHPPDFRPASVDNDRINAHVFQENDIFGKFLLQTSSSMAAPPYFMTKVEPENVFM